MILTLGLFQLESLALASAPHQFFDLRLQPMALPSARVQACLDRAQVVDSHFLMQHLENYKIGVHEPIILVCEDGRLSNSAALDLANKGYEQVYVVEGGTDGLLREADDFSSSGNIM